MGTGVSVVPSGSFAPSSPRQPPRWKSLIITTSRFGSVDSARMLPATFSAGENRVDDGLGVAVSTDASAAIAPRSNATGCRRPSQNNTTEPRSDAVSPAICVAAAACARAHRSPNPML